MSEKSLQDAIAEGVAAIQGQRNPYESEMVQAVAAQEPGPPPPAPVTPPAADGE